MSKREMKDLPMEEDTALRIVEILERIETHLRESHENLQEFKRDIIYAMEDKIATAINRKLDDIESTIAHS